MTLTVWSSPGSSRLTITSTTPPRTECSSPFCPPKHSTPRARGRAAQTVFKRNGHCIALAFQAPEAERIALFGNLLRVLAIGLPVQGFNPPVTRTTRKPPPSSTRQAAEHIRLKPGVPTLESLATATPPVLVIFHEHTNDSPLYTSKRAGLRASTVP